MQILSIHSLRRAFCLTCLFCCWSTNKLQAEVHVFFADTIWTGEETVTDGALVATDGTVTSVGKRSELTWDASATIHELGQVTLIPGLVIAQSSLVESSGADPYALSPEIRAVDGFDPFADRLKLLASGVTCLQVTPAGNKLLAGQGGVVRLGVAAGEHVLRETESLQINLNSSAFSPSTIYEPPVGAVSEDRPLDPTQPQLATSLSQAVVGLEAIFAEVKQLNRNQSSGDSVLDGIAELLQSETPVRWNVRNASEVQAALALSKRFELPWIVVDPQELGSLVSEKTWESTAAYGVLLSPEIRPGQISNPPVPRRGLKETQPVWKRIKQLIDAGAEARIALHATADSDLDQILFTASILGRAGIEREQILRMLTTNPANLMGIEQQVGSLRPGCFADFAVVKGQPLDASSRVTATYVGGKPAYTYASTPIAKTQSFTIEAAKVYTPQGVIEGARIGVASGRITGLGESVSIPVGATLKSFPGAVVVPGMIDCGANVGMGSSLGDQISFGTKLGDILARDDSQVAMARQGGFTTVLLSSSRLPSPVVAFKLTDQPHVLKDPVALRFQIRGNLTAAEENLRKTLAAGKAYADSWSKYEAEMVEYRKQLKEYEAAKKKFDAAQKAAEEKKKKEAESKKEDESKDSVGSKNESKGDSNEKGKQEDARETASEDKEASTSKTQTTNSKPESPATGSKKPESDEEKLEEPKKPSEPKKPRSSENSEPYRELFARKIPAMVDVSDSQALDVVVKLFRKEFDVKTAVVAGEAAAQRGALLKKNDIFVVVGPSLVSQKDGDIWNFPAELAIQGVELGIQSRASTGVKELPNAIAYAVYEGFGRSDALKAVTTSPVQFFGLENMGALQVGSDADLVVLSGPPLELATEVLAVMIDGQWVYEKEN